MYSYFILLGFPGRPRFPRMTNDWNQSSPKQHLRHAFNQVDRVQRHLTPRLRFRAAGPTMRRNVGTVGPAAAHSRRFLAERFNNVDRFMMNRVSNPPSSAPSLASSEWRDFDHVRQRQHPPLPPPLPTHPPPAPPRPPLPTDMRRSSPVSRSNNSQLQTLNRD